MKNQFVTKPEKDIIRFLSSNLPKLRGIYLFGSHADGTARKESDFDIGFLLEYPGKLNASELFSLSNELARQLSADVDLVDLRQTNIDFRFVIVSTGKRIFCNDETLCDTFEMITYSMYQRFEEERKPIIQAIKKRGRIYG